MNSASPSPARTNAGTQPEPLAEPVCCVDAVPLVSPDEPPVVSPVSTMPRFSHSEPSVEDGVLPSAGVICICGVGSEDPLSSVVVVVVLVVVVVVVVVPPTGMVSPMLTVVPRAQHAPEKRARQSENIRIAWVACIISQSYIVLIILKHSEILRMRTRQALRAPAGKASFAPRMRRLSPRGRGTEGRRRHSWIKRRMRSRV